MIDIQRMMVKKTRIVCEDNFVSQSNFERVQIFIVSQCFYFSAAKIYISIWQGEYFFNHQKQWQYLILVDNCSLLVVFQSMNHHPISSKNIQYFLLMNWYVGSSAKGSFSFRSLILLNIIENYSTYIKSFVSGVRKSQHSNNVALFSA